ncbi:MAG: cyclic nucleotide-binding domain-containing protein, partial [Acidobacteriota bacterium]
MVVRAALASAARTGDERHVPAGIEALRSPATRTAARRALERLGPVAFDDLVTKLNDTTADPLVRHHIPRALAGIPTQATVDALIRSYDLKETSQLLDDRTLQALVRLRRRHDRLAFDRDEVLRLMEREVSTARRYAGALASVSQLNGDRESVGLLSRALDEARAERRRSTFRWLGLISRPEGMYRCSLAMDSGDARSRANAIEWLETTVGHGLFRRLQPLLEPPRKDAKARREADRDPAETLRRLWDDEDHWIARCAIWAAVDLGLPGTWSDLGTFQPADADLEALVGRLNRRRAGSIEPGRDEKGRGAMDTIEKLFLLQNIDLLRDAPSAQLALLASIATEIHVDTGADLLELGQPADAMYVVVRGRVELEGRGEERLVAQEGEAFGTWALIDAAPSVMGATVSEPTHLLRIRRQDFNDLLADYPELGLGLLQGLAKRVRTLLPA